MSQPRQGRCLLCIWDRGIEKTPVLPIAKLHTSEVMMSGRTWLCDYHFAQLKELTE